LGGFWFFECAKPPLEKNTDSLDLQGKSELSTHKPACFTLFRFFISKKWKQEKQLKIPIIKKLPVVGSGFEPLAHRVSSRMLYREPEGS